VSTPRDNVPPHYTALRVLWTALQVALLLIVFVLLAQAVPPGELIGDVGDWARDL
jgi:hypothetical protein